MKHTYQVAGMTCGGCQKKVISLLKSVSGVQEVNAVNMQTVEVQMEYPVSAHVLNEALNKYPQYRLYASGNNVEGFWNDTNVWKKAGRNTLNCLIGCSIGDFGMIIYLQTYHQGINMFTMMLLAMATGLATSVVLETVLLKINEKFNWFFALKTALGMSFLSMLAMEFSENATDLLLTKGQVSPSEPFYWIALGISLVAGFVVPLPYNYYKLKKYGKACH